MVLLGRPRYNLETPMTRKSQLMCHTMRNEMTHGTTVLCVRRGNQVVVASAGQVTMGQAVVKHTAKKIRRLYDDKVLAGFAGGTADALSLFSRFEAKLHEHHGNLAPAAGALAQEGRNDKEV